MKRIVWAAAFVAALVAWAAGPAGTAAGLAGSTTEVIVEPGPGQQSYAPARVDLELRTGELPARVQWRWGPGGGGSQAPHDVVHRRGLFSTPLQTEGTYTRTFSAGFFSYFCTIHEGMTGVVTVEPWTEPIDGSKPFRLRWASANSNAGDVYDVRFRVGNRRWRPWRKDTSKPSGIFGRKGKPARVRCGRRYSFQARSQKAGKPRERSGWSPTHAYVACG